MPMTVSVGLSRKRSANYNSDGVTINLSAELDQSLLSQPQRLQGEVSKLYTQAREAIERESIGEASPTNHTHANGAHASRFNGSNGSNGNSSSGGPRPMTASQSRALYALASKAGLDLEAEATTRFGTHVGGLDIRQASQLIDELKKVTA